MENTLGFQKFYFYQPLFSAEQDIQLIKTAIEMNLSKTIFISLQIYLAAPATAIADVFSGCSLSLPPTLGGSCDYINSQFSSGTLRHQFSVEGGGNSFGIDPTGQAYLKATVITLSDDGTQGSADVKYEFRVQDVYFHPPPYIKIECMNNTNCIKFSGVGISSSDISSTTLISDDDAGLMHSLARSFIKLREYFCDVDKC